MDSISQFALGAAVAVAATGRRTAVWKAALWGGVCGTLPDLDALIDHGDAVLNMTLHRGDSHSLLWLSLLSPVLATAIAHATRRPGQALSWRRWWLATWLALFTHPLLDWTTLYGTQLLRPFSPEPYGLGSMFIIDPLYTLPLLIGLAGALRRPLPRGLSANALGLALSTAYLFWSAAAQYHVIGVAQRSLAAQGLHAERLLVTPTAFNTVLWRIVAVDGAVYHEGFHSLLDDAQPVTFDRFARGSELLHKAGSNDRLDRIRHFSQGFWRMVERDGVLRIADLRMGQEPFFFFDFEIARDQDGRYAPITPRMAGSRPDVARAVPWLWRRLLGERLPPPR